MRTIKTVLHEFLMGDVEDPYLYAGDPLHKWQMTEAGQWAMAHCVVQPEFVCQPSPEVWSYIVRVTGELNERDYAFWCLKYGQ